MVNQGFKVDLEYRAYFIKHYKGEVRKRLDRVAILTRQVTTKHLLTALVLMCLVIRHLALKQPYFLFSLLTLNTYVIYPSSFPQNYCEGAGRQKVNFSEANH